jgi:hypothetical protein
VGRLLEKGAPIDCPMVVAERGGRVASADLPASLWPTVHRLATGEGWPPATPDAVNRLVAATVTEGMTPLLFAQDGLPPLVRQTLDGLTALDRLNARRSQLMLAAIRRVAEALREEAFAFLKGADYAHRLYPHPTLRPMGDVDILVPRDRVDAISARLVACGMERKDTGPITTMASYYAQTFRIGHISLDVHHSFVQRIRARVDYDALWRRREPLVVAGLPAGRLGDVDALVYHAISMAKDEFCVPLSRHVDLWLMARARPDIWAPAAERAREWGVERALYGALQLARRLFPELDDLGAGRTTERLLTPRVRRFLDRRVLPDPWEHGSGRGLSRRARLWRKFWLMDDARRRGAFLGYHAWALLWTRGEGSGVRPSAPGPPEAP